VSVGGDPDTVLLDLQQSLIGAQLHRQAEFPVKDQVQVEHVAVAEQPGQLLDTVDAEEE